MMLYVPNIVAPTNSVNLWSAWTFVTYKLIRPNMDQNKDCNVSNNLETEKSILIGTINLVMLYSKEQILNIFYCSVKSKSVMTYISKDLDVYHKITNNSIGVEHYIYKL